MNEDQEGRDEMEINGILDLHMFLPRDVKNLVRDYLEACLERDILDVRIIHGKGVGVQREIVRSLLEKHPAVESFGHGSSWGATVVRLRSGTVKENGG